MITHSLKRILRAPLQALATMLFAAILAAVLCGLKAANDAEIENYQETYRTIPVTLTVSNLTGTKTDMLMLPAWVGNVFTRDYGVRNNLTGYVRDVQQKMTLKSGIDTVLFNGTMVPVTRLVGLTSLGIDSQLNAQNGAMVTWHQGFGEDILTTEELVCVVPESVLPGVEGTEASLLDMTFSHTNLGERIEFRLSLRIVGTHKADAASVYCPYEVIKKIYGGLGKRIEADCVSATVLDNDYLDEVREEASHWFAEPNIQGVEIPWDYSWYLYYPFALIVDDSQLTAAAETMENSILINKICTVLVFALSAGAGFFIGFLMIRSRKREIVLLRTMGTPNGSIYLSFAFEQMLCVILGTVLGGACFLWQPPDRLTIFAGVYFVGLTMALVFFLHSNLLSTIKEDE